MPFVQVKVVPSVLQVVLGKSGKSMQLGPVHVYCSENVSLEPQETKLPCAEVMLKLRERGKETW